MRLRSALTINGKYYSKGTEISWYKVYPFFLIHMLGFGASGFFMAYTKNRPDLFFIYAHGGIAIVIYILFYLAFFGVDRVKWMFINAALGLFGIYAQIGWILRMFGKNVDDYPIYIHVTPFLYYVLYTFLLHQLVLDMAGVRETEEKRKRVDFIYVATSLFVYGATYLITR